MENIMNENYELEEIEMAETSGDFDDSEGDGIGKLIGYAFILGGAAFGAGQWVGSKIGSPVEAAKKVAAKRKAKKAVKEAEKLEKEQKKLTEKAAKLNDKIAALEIPETDDVEFIFEE